MTDYSSLCNTKPYLAQRYRSCDFHRDAEGRWWFLTVGKGNKERKISVSNAMLKALKDYRKTLGLPPFPRQMKTRLYSYHIYQIKH